MSEKAEKPLRIAYFSDAPWIGGAERYLFLLASNLKRDEFAPSLIMNRNRRLEPLKDWMAGAGIEAREVSLDLPRSHAGVREFIGILRDIRPAILHCNLPGPWGAQYGLVAPIARFAGVRRVVTTEHLPMVRPYSKGALLKIAATAFIDRVITVSEDNVRYLVDYHRIPRGKIRVVRIGVPDPGEGTAAPVRRERALVKGDFLCVMIGSFEERKGHATAFDALTRLNDRVKLLLIGAGAREEELRRRVSELRLEKRVHFLGYREDVAAVLRAVDALIVPSNLEATPFVIVEAMAAGLPVIASRVFGIPELVVDGESGILIAPGKGEDLASAIASLADDSSRTARMGAEGRRRYEEAFRIERCAAETAAVYHELLGSDASRKEHR